MEQKRERSRANKKRRREEKKEVFDDVIFPVGRIYLIPSSKADAAAAASANGEPALKKPNNGNTNNPSGWVDMTTSTGVYFSGIPIDATEAEIKEFFSKCGVIKEDPITMKPRIKMYKDKDGASKVHRTI